MPRSALSVSIVVNSERMVFNALLGWPAWAVLASISAGVCVVAPSFVGLVAVLVAVSALTSGSIRERFAGYLLGTWLVLVVIAVLFAPAS